MVEFQTGLAGEEQHSEVSGSPGGVGLKVQKVRTTVTPVDIGIRK